MAKKYDELIEIINRYLAILRRTKSEQVYNATLELLRGLFRQYAIDPDDTDDPAACRKYLAEVLDNDD